MEGLFSKKQMDFFFDHFSMKKNAPRCGETLIFIIFVGRQRFRRVVFDCDFAVAEIDPGSSSPLKICESRAGPECGRHIVSPECQHTWR